MTSKFSLKDLADQITHLIPSDIKLLKKDLDQSIYQLVQSAFNKLDLVTREEFDVQTKVLARTRQKIQTLELEMQALTAKLNGPTDE